MKYEGTKSYLSKYMTKVKVFADIQTDAWTNGRGKNYNYAPDLSMRGHENGKFTAYKLRSNLPYTFQINLQRNCCKKKTGTFSETFTAENLELTLP